MFTSTPLHIAIYRQEPDEVNILLSAGANPNASGEFGERPLQVALVCGNLKLVELLLRAGARCDFKNDNGENIWQISDIFNLRQSLEEIVRRTAPSQL